MKKKLAVIGKGTSGCQSIIHFLRYMPDCEIEWYFDPNVPTQSVGEGSAIQFPKNLFLGLNFSYFDLNKIDGSVKFGIYKSGWGNQKDFLHQFVPPQISFHFSAKALQQYVFDSVKDKVKIIEANVTPDKIDADYVMSCAGKPESYDEFHRSSYIPVNAAYITQCFWDYPRFQYTLTIARPYGWVFGIPLQNRCSIGYLYNRNINTESEVKEDVKNIFKQYNLIPSDTTNSLKFENYYKKQTHHGRVSYNGNASFFLEPMEATSISTMDRIQRGAFDVWNGNTNLEDANLMYYGYMLQIQAIIMLHYFAGSCYDTDFWKFAQERGKECIQNTLKYDEYLMQMLNHAIIKSKSNLCEDLGEYGIWGSNSFHENIFGLGINKSLQNLLNQ